MAVLACAKLCCFQLFSGYDLVNERGTARVAFSGSFWADPETASLVRIAVQADGIPSCLDVRSAETDIRYGDVRLDVRAGIARAENGVYVSVGTRRFVLPQSASVRLVREFGEDKRNSVNSRIAVNIPPNRNSLRAIRMPPRRPWSQPRSRFRPVLP